MPPPTDEDLQRMHAEAEHATKLLMARLRDLEQRHRAVLRTAAEELTRVGAITLRTTAGDIHGRLVRFGNRTAVLELFYPRGWSQSRVSAATADDACFHGLAHALAQIGADAEPCE